MTEREVTKRTITTVEYDTQGQIVRETATTEHLKPPSPVVQPTVGGGLVTPFYTPRTMPYIATNDTNTGSLGAANVSNVSYFLAADHVESQADDGDDGLAGVTAS